MLGNNQMELFDKKLFKNLSTLPGFNFLESPRKPVETKDVIDIHTNVNSEKGNVNEKIYMSFLTFLDNTKNKSSRKKKNGTHVRSKKKKQKTKK